VETRFSAPVQTGPGTHLVSYTMATRSLPGVTWRKSRAAPPVLLWAVTACSRENFTLTILPPTDIVVWVTKPNACTTIIIIIIIVIIIIIIIIYRFFAGPSGRAV